MNSTHNGTTNDDAEKFNYQSKERDIESGYDYFEARLYDSATGRFLQVDPKAHLLNSQNSYTGMNNNPNINIDPNGEFSLNVHYDMTLKVLKKYGVGSSSYNQGNIAHMASTYADNASLGVETINQAGRSDNVNIMKRPGVDYSNTKNSQADYPTSVRRHGMRSTMEHITKLEAMNRGLRYGWDNIMVAAKKKSSEDMNSGFMRNLGVGLHALQDSYAHKGASTYEHLGKNGVGFFNEGAREMISKDISPDLESYTQAQNATESAMAVIGIMQGDLSVLVKLLNSGKKLDLSGMSDSDRKDLYKKLNSFGSNITIEEDGKKVEDE